MRTALSVVSTLPETYRVFRTLGLVAPNLAEPEVAERNQVSEKEPPWRPGLFDSEGLLNGAGPRRQIENTKALPGLLQRL